MSRLKGIRWLLIGVKLSSVVVLATFLLAATLADSVSAASQQVQASSVAKVSVFSTSEKDNHSFVLIENLTNNHISVGHLGVGGHDFATIGTWGNLAQHKGIWYNLEANNGFRISTPHLSVYTYINSNELNNMNNKINSIDRWEYLINCSSFAVDVWNSISDHKLSAGIVNTPRGLASSMKKVFNPQTNASYPYKNRDGIRYHTSWGVVSEPNPTFTHGGGSSSFALRPFDIDRNEVTSFE